MTGLLRRLTTAKWFRKHLASFSTSEGTGSVGGGDARLVLVEEECTTLLFARRLPDGDVIGVAVLDGRGAQDTLRWDLVSLVQGFRIAGHRMLGVPEWARLARLDLFERHRL